MTPETGRTALYRLYEERADQLVYVGITSDPARRFAEHAARKPWWPCVSRKIIEWYGTREAAQAAEEAAIKQFEPWFNTDHCRYPAEFTVTVRMNRFQLPGIDILRARHGLSREELLAALLVRELQALGLTGESPCPHFDLPGWPDGLTVQARHYDSGICVCGAPEGDSAA